MALPKGHISSGKIISIDYGVMNKSGHDLNRISAALYSGESYHFLEIAPHPGRSNFVVNGKFSWEVTHPGYGNKPDWCVKTESLDPDRPIREPQPVIGTKDFRECCIIMQSSWNQAIALATLQADKKITFEEEEKADSFSSIRNLAQRIANAIVEDARVLQKKETTH